MCRLMFTAKGTIIYKKNIKSSISCLFQTLNTCRDLCYIYHTEVFFKESPSLLKVNVLLGGLLVSNKHVIILRWW